MTTVITSFSTEIKEARMLMGISQQALANQIGVSVQTINYLEVGTRIPSLDLLRRIAEALGCCLQIKFVPKSKVLLDTTKGLGL
jgi:DNA-binding XRE family transcriptional regulator